ncbi:regulatory protein, luxR family [Prevotella sp. KH2C16]|nr:regulatory protein, luxR family [Prevotella sp. KH2C16]
MIMAGMNMIQFINERLKRIDGKAMGFESGVVHQLRLQVLRAIVIIVVLGSMLNVFGLSGPEDFFASNLVYGVAILVIYMLARLRYLPLLLTLYLIFFITQVYLSGEMIYTAFYPHDYSVSLILSDIILHSGLLCMTTFVYMPMVTLGCYVLGGASYVVACAVLGSPILTEALPVLLLLYTLTVYLSVQLKRYTVKVLIENNMFKDNEKSLLDFFRMDRSQLLDYIQLAKRKNLSPQETNMFLSSFGTEAKENFLANVDMLVRHQLTSNKLLDDKLPNLTPSEKEIVRLVIQGLRLSEICTRLGKTESNVCAQHSRIRKKMGLAPEDNLYEKLCERLL